MSLRVETLVVCAALLATSPVLAIECDDPLDIGRGEVTFHVPSSYDATVPTPLMIMLHPWPYIDTLGETYLQLAPLSDQHGFLYALPEGTPDENGDPAWNATDAFRHPTTTNPDDSGYLKLLIDTIKSRCNVDPRRIYLFGYSNGGFMAYRMACDHAKSISAIASLGGATFYEKEDCQPKAPVHVLQIHGSRDQLIPYSGGFRSAPFPGAVQTVETWAGYNRCSLVSEEIPAALDLDWSLAGEETSITRYPEGCRPGSSAELWTIVGGRHQPNLSDQFSDLVVEHLLSRLGCSGKERLKKIRCTAAGRLKVRLRKGMGGDSYVLGLSDDTVMEGRLNRRGRTNIRILNMPSGEGTAVVFWGCEATAERAYHCP
jgi:polyhydroxybutyrate depolymerase